MKCRICGCTELSGCPGVCGWAEDELCTICDAFIDELADTISVFTALTAATEDPARFTQAVNLALREASARMRAEFVDHELMEVIYVSHAPILAVRRGRARVERPPNAP